MKYKAGERLEVLGMAVVLLKTSGDCAGRSRADRVLEEMREDLREDLKEEKADTRAGFVVEVQPGCWLASGGERTLVLDYARVYQSERGTAVALRQARAATNAKWATARTYPVALRSLAEDV